MYTLPSGPDRSYRWNHKGFVGRNLQFHFCFLPGPFQILLCPECFPSDIPEFILIKTLHSACCCSHGDITLLHLVFLWKLTKEH